MAAQVVGGMVGGAVGGAIGGGDLESAKQGAIIGGLLAGADLAAASWVPSGPNVRAARTVIRSSAMAAYGVSVGADPILCGAFTAVVDLSGYLFSDFVQWKASPLPGKNSSDPFYRPIGNQIPLVQEHNNLIGSDSPGKTWLGRLFAQGGPVSRMLNVIPGMKAVGDFHDSWLWHTNAPGPSANWLTMLPSAAVSIPAAYGRTPEIYRRFLEKRAADD